MTEAQQEQQPQSPYEQFRDSFVGGEDSYGDPRLGSEWRNADRWREHLKQQLADIEADPELSSEGREARMQRAYDQLAPKIRAHSEAAKAKAQRFAREHADRSVPMPGGSLRGSDITDATELAAIQNETAAIVEMAKSGSITSKIQERTGKRPRNIQETGNKTLAALQQFFGEALEASGVEAKVQAHATLKAARQLGINPEDVYAPFREERHMAALEEAQRYQQAYQTIPTSVPSVDRGEVPGGHHWRKSGAKRSAVPPRGPLSRRTKRRPSWK